MDQPAKTWTLTAVSPQLIFLACLSIAMLCTQESTRLAAVESAPVTYIKSLVMLQNHELRVEVKENKALSLTVSLQTTASTPLIAVLEPTDTCIAMQLKDGQAEIFGTELHVGETLTLKGQKLAVCFRLLEVNSAVL